MLRGHSKRTFTQDSQVLTSPPSLVCPCPFLSQPPPPPPPQGKFVLARTPPLPLSFYTCELIC